MKRFRSARIVFGVACALGLTAFAQPVLGQMDPPYPVYEDCTGKSREQVEERLSWWHDKIKDNLEFYDAEAAKLDNLLKSHRDYVQEFRRPEWQFYGDLMRGYFDMFFGLSRDYQIRLWQKFMGMHRATIAFRKGFLNQSMFAFSLYAQNALNTLNECMEALERAERGGGGGPARDEEPDVRDVPEHPADDPIWGSVEDAPVEERPRRPPPPSTDGDDDDDDDDDDDGGDDDAGGG